MSMTLYLKTLKRNWKLLLIFFLILLMYFSIMTAMYDPEDMAAIISMIELFPEDLMRAMGFDSIVTNLTEYLASWLYGFLMFAFPMIYCIILSHRLVSKMVDDGSMAFLLSTPLKRTQIIITQGLYALSSVLILFLMCFVSGTLIAETMQPGALDIKAFFMLNVTTMLVNMAIIMIGFFASSVFNDAKYALSIGSGVPIVFLLMKMLGSISEEGQIISDMSLYGLYNPVSLVNQPVLMWYHGIYAGIVVILFTLSVYIFKKKQLPI
jgi:ABC-2 type transport system permease protein